MPQTKTKKIPFPIYPISDWSVTKYGVTLIVNPNSIPFFDEGCSLDVEDDEQGNFVGCGIYNPSDNTCYYWSELYQFQAVVLSKFVAHNGISDVRKLQKWGFKIDESWLLWDTQLMAHMLDSSRRQYGLKNLVKLDLGITYPTYEDLCGKKSSKHHRTLDQLPLELVSEYNSMDCYSTYKLYEQQAKSVGDMTCEASTAQYFNCIEKPSGLVFSAMEEKGIKVDLAYLSDLKDSLEGQLLAVKLPILNELGAINLDSPKQLLAALKAKGIDPQMRGKSSTDKRALENWRGNRLVDLLLKYSELSTLLSSFVYPYLERNEAVVHPHFNQTGTRTGRPSCSNPNLLQIPRRTENGKLVRRMFVARDGKLFGDIDLGQIEPRIMAHLSQDNILCQMFNNGTDFHTFTSERLSINRERAKILNLSVGYRATYKSVSQQLKCNWDSAQKEIDKWWSIFPNLYDWQQKMLYQAKKDGFITTLMGRRIRVEDLMHGNEYRRESAERQAINNLIQGSAAEVMKLWMVQVDKANIDILIQVYDELVIEEPEQGIQEACNKVLALLPEAVKLSIPLVAEAGIGINWGDSKP